MPPPGQAFAPSAPASSALAIALCGLIALAVAVGIGRFAFTPILPMMQDDAGLNVAQGGWLASANYFGYLVGALWATFQRAQPARAIRAALVVTSVATVAMAFAEGLAMWFVLRFIAGVSSAWGLIHVTSWCVERLAPIATPALNGTVFAGVGTGILVAGLLCLALMGAGAGSRDAWLALGLLGLLITAAVWPVVGAGPAARAVPRAPKYRWNADAVRLVACYGAFGLGYIIPATFIPVMARQVVPDPTLFGWAWPIFGAAAAASTLLAATRLRRLGNRKLWKLAALLMALGVVSPLMLSGCAGILIAALLVGATFMVITMAGVQEARAIAGASASVLVAAMTAAFAAGQIIGPLLVSGFVAQGNGFAEALLLGCGVLLASVAGLAYPRKPPLCPGNGEP